MIALGEGNVAINFGFYDGEVWEDNQTGHIIPRSLWDEYQAKAEELSELAESIRRHPFGQIDNGI